MNKEKLKLKIEKKKTELQELETQLKNLQKELNILEEVTYKGKTYQIVKWTKQLKDFPKLNKMVTFQIFNKLIDEKKIELEVYKYYFVKHWSKLQWNKEFCLSRCCLGGNSDLDSNGSSLSGSYDVGRVVIVK